MSEFFREYASYARDTCDWIDSSLYGIMPSSPKLTRSSRVKAVPLLSWGTSSSNWPRNNVLNNRGRMGVYHCYRLNMYYVLH